MVRRRDGLIAYQLACAVDESEMGITHVVRGADLVSSTFRQRELMLRLGLSLPAYAHLPVMLATDGRKLSKQNHAEPIDPARASDNLVTALKHLGQALPEQAHRWTPQELMSFAIENWDEAPLRADRR